MFIRPASDLHNEFQPWNIPMLDTDANTVLVLAGDIDLRARSADWLAPIAARFKAVVMVLGNHDYWKDSLDVAPKRLKERVSALGLTNVHVLDRDTVVIDDPLHPVRFIGATLWTDFNKADPFAMYDAHQTMKDYKKIRNQAGRVNLHTNAILGRHRGDRDYIKAEVEKHFDGHTVVVTHHAPSEQSISPLYNNPKNKSANAAYFSNLDEWASSLVFTYWFHGHTHHNFDYSFGAVGRVICNPRGYAPNALNEDFDPALAYDMNSMTPGLLVAGSTAPMSQDYASWWESAKQDA